MDDMYYKENIGSLRISEDVISTIAKLSAIEVDGVADVKGSGDGIKSLIKTGFQNKSIGISLSDDVATIDVPVTVEYGCKISEVASQVQTAVKTAVQNMTGIAVAKVNIYIAGVSFDNIKSAE